MNYNQYEDSITGTFVNVLNDMHEHPTASGINVVHRQRFLNTNFEPDLTFDVCGNVPVPIEAKFDDRASGLKKQEERYLGLSSEYLSIDEDGCIDIFATAEIRNALTIRIPKYWRSQSNWWVLRNVKNQKFKVTCVTEAGESLQVPCDIHRLVRIAKFAGEPNKRLIIAYEKSKKTYSYHRYRR